MFFSKKYWFTIKKKNEKNIFSFIMEDRLNMSKKEKFVVNFTEDELIKVIDITEDVSSL